MASMCVGLGFLPPRVTFCWEGARRRRRGRVTAGRGCGCQCGAAVIDERAIVE